MQGRRAEILIPADALDLGPAWAGNTVNCVPFRASGVLTAGDTRIVTFFDYKGDIVIAQVDRTTGTVRTVVITNPLKPYDAHQAISAGLDEAGRLHLAYGAHASSLLLLRSKTSSIADGFTGPAEFRGKNTYPTFLTLPGGDLMMLFRRGRSVCGEWLVAHWRPASEEWQQDPTPIISGSGGPTSCGPYINTPARTADGKVFLFLVWRLPAAASSAGSAANIGIDCLTSDDRFATLKTINGVAVARPVVPATSERVVAVPLGRSLINQASATILGEGHPGFVTYWDEGGGVPQYRLGWHDGRAWRVSTVSDFRTPFRLDGVGTLPLPHSRPEVLADAQGRVMLFYRSHETGNRLCMRMLYPPDYRLNASRLQVLVDEDLGFYEPVLDRSGWAQHGEISLYVQYCKQALGGDEQRGEFSANARLRTWRPNPSADFSADPPGRTGLWALLRNKLTHS